METLWKKLLKEEHEVQHYFVWCYCFIQWWKNFLVIHSNLYLLHHKLKPFIQMVRCLSFKLINLLLILLTWNQKLLYVYCLVQAFKQFAIDHEWCYLLFMNFENGVRTFFQQDLVWYFFLPMFPLVKFVEYC